MLYVLKFGGSSLSTTQKIKDVANYIHKINSNKNTKLIVVVSAMGKTTNKLITLAEKITSKTSTAYSSLLSLGENISTYLLTMALEELGSSAVGLTSKDIKIHSSGLPINSLITHIDKSKIQKELDLNKIVVVSGFQGENQNNQTLTLGRGGSDTTAVALGHLFNAKVKIFTDVEGFYSLNPNKYNKPKLLRKINIKSAIELACVNAKILDYRSLCLANQNQTIVSVGKSLNKTITNINFTPIENYKIDGLSLKTKIMFVKNTSNKTNLLQFISNQSAIQTYFYQKNTNEFWATNFNKKELELLFNHKNKQIILKNADILLITGSGLLIHENFIKKVQNCINNLKIPIYHLNLTQTSLTIITKQNQANKLETAFAKEFNLIEEQL